MTWAVAQFEALTGALVTCEAVLSEAFFLLRRFPQHRRTLRQMLVDEVFDLSFHLGDESRPVSALMHRYHEVPMSLADACLVRLSELHPKLPVLSTDSDFRIYRRNRRQLIRCLLPHGI